jgi:glycosyltransferase involved in cell wall biosynthesis
MKILVLCDRFPYPLENGQSLRIFHYVRELAARHTFDLLCYAESGALVPSPIKPMFRSVWTFPRPQSTRSNRLSRLFKAFRLDEFCPCSESVIEFLAQQGPSADWDLVWISGWDMVVNLPNAFDSPVLMDAVDEGVLEHVRELKRARSPGEAVKTLKRLVMNYRFERRYFGPADACLFVSEVDAAFFSRVSPGTPTYVLHNGVDTEFFKPSSVIDASHDIVFEGNMSFSPNADAAIYFATCVLPLIKGRIPDVRFWIVGKNPVPSVSALASLDVEVTGFVEDVRPYLDRAAVFVCPLRKGAGIKNKILQAWAMGKPVVATSKSTGGLAVQEGTNILVRDGPQAIADAVVELLENPAKRQSIAAAARATAESSYNWARQASALESVMTKIVGSREFDHA